ncbi:peptidoglycan DD-metalloendopeptidase family protein [Oceaniradius stylonematis]|uniref:peptidoglycan DD-metalloendopeptidase family protein n=1 Tax=Oceaniradius stylonematis TaxID=2184161 RepID=UPI003C7BA9D2
MRMFDARRRSASLLQTVSVLVLGGLVSGCAGDVMRFTDDFYTNSVPVRPPAAVQTPFPENAPRIVAVAPQAPAAPAHQAFGNGVDTMATGSIGQAASSVPAAVGRAPIAAPSVASQPMPPAPSNAVTDVINNSAASLPQQARQAAASAATSAAGRAAGWTGTGGTYVTLARGETLFNLSKRYGVPVDALKSVNNLSDARGVQAGQRILIPTYVYGRTVPVSAPDANSGVRSARASVGGRSDVSLDRAPVPTARPQASVRPAMPTQTAAAPAATPSASLQGGRYTVQSGDTLSAISRRTGASVAAIKRTNGLSSDMVRVGQRLTIPGLSGDVSATATAALPPNVDPMVTSSVTPAQRPASSSSGSVQSIDESSTARAPDATGVANMRWPARGRIISGFGSNSGGRPNDGIDISVPKGTPVKAAENGVVIYAGDGLKEFGETVLVRHSDGYVTVYGHLDSMSVSRGDNVSRGQTLGASGMSGNARQPQLHFEVRKDSRPVDPTRYLN